MPLCCASSARCRALVSCSALDDARRIAPSPAIETSQMLFLGTPEVVTMPMRLFPRPSILASVVVATSVVGGLAFGVMAGAIIVFVAPGRRS